MKPEKKEFSEQYELVETDDFLPGIISDIKYDLTHKMNYKGQEKVGPAVKIKFLLDGYKSPHFSKWLSFNYHEKSNLYKNYLAVLVDKAEPYMDFDLDSLKGLKVKVLWAQKTTDDGKIFQYPETVRPMDGKISGNHAAEEDDHEEEQIPF